MVKGHWSGKHEMDQSWAIKTKSVCYTCGHSVEDGAKSCHFCGGTDIDPRRARPMKTEPKLLPPLPFPWNQLTLRHGATVILSGDAGSGKTSSCIKLRPHLYASSEQELVEVGHAWHRLMPNEEPPILTSCSSWEELHQDVLTLDSGQIGVLDSVSQLSDGPESNKQVKSVIEAVREREAIFIFIAQFTKDGMMKGNNMLNHMVDVICKIPNDPLGLRQLKAEKNRFGSLWSQYFTFNTGGELVEQPFQYAYSVEGSAGKYRLHLHPMGGAKLNGILSVLGDNGICLEGYASAAVTCPGYKRGFAEPPDAKQRKEFAVQHGLRWIGPDEAQELLRSQGE